MADMGTLSFAQDIRPMFTDLDVAHMKSGGLDLSDYESVKAQADAIYTAVSNGTMPPKPSGEARWSSEMCARFKQWQDGGCPP